MEKVKLEKLKEIIVEAVPSILELKFGCLIETQKWTFKGSIETIISSDSDLEDFDCAYRFGSRIRKSEIREILGRPILIDDVLVAIYKIEKQKRVLIKANGRFVVDEWFDDGTARGYWQTNDGAKWQLNKPLSEQKKEVWDFLLEILTKE